MAAVPKLASRVLLSFSAAILALGGFMHTRAFGRTVAAVAASNLEPFFGKALQALWLIDSATLLTLAATFIAIAARPALASRTVLALLAILPAATATLLYWFLGSFLPAHMLLAAAAFAWLAALTMTPVASKES